MKSEKRVALVTGASSGLGLAIAEELHGAGYRVYGASRKAADANPPGGFEPIKMDVDHDSSVEAAIADVVAREGRLDVVVSNAGVGFAGALEDTSSEEALAQFQTNFFGNHRVCRTALPHLRARDPAHLVVVGSIAGLIALPFQGMYSAAKFALEGYCEALRMELRGSSVRVAIVEPGDFATGFTAARRLTAASGPGSAYRKTFEAALAAIEADETSGADPVLVGRAVKRIVELDRPALRYPIGALAQTAVARAKPFIPAGAFEALIASHYKC
ncbi:SDR family oxidoreductase [Methylocapsa acidiphila]|uniref:SDR family oxidoreductase n=1 Tax=Methylocapsa acidiphila TaxID=133552 RepID=UPI00041B1D73|nr:SDR family oxidoreductase [Methylocapsa acidiphila]